MDILPAAKAGGRPAWRWPIKLTAPATYETFQTPLTGQG